MADTTYNGWTNWATWNVALWFDNDEPLYREKRRFVATTVLTDDKVEKFVKELLPKGTPDFKGEGGAKNYNDVDWEAIATSWEEDEA